MIQQNCTSCFHAGCKASSQLWAIITQPIGVPPQKNKGKKRNGNLRTFRSRLQAVLCHAFMSASYCSSPSSPLTICSHSVLRGQVPNAYRRQFRKKLSFPSHQVCLSQPRVSRRPLPSSRGACNKGHYHYAGLTHQRVVKSLVLMLVRGVVMAMRTTQRQHPHKNRCEAVNGALQPVVLYER